MQKIVPNLWFDSQAEEAANFYVSLFKNAKIGRTARYGEEAAKVSGMPAGSVMTVEFTLEGQDFIAINGGPQFKFTEAVSFLIYCDTQEEIDMFWGKLTADGGEESVCGWLKDKYGLSWQVAPRMLDDWIQDENQEKAERAMAAMLKMKKLDIAELKRAYEGK